MPSPSTPQKHVGQQRKQPSPGQQCLRPLEWPAGGGRKDVSIGVTLHFPGLPAQAPTKARDQEYTETAENITGLLFASALISVWPEGAMLSQISWAPREAGCKISAASPQGLVSLEGPTATTGSWDRKNALKL